MKTLLITLEFPPFKGGVANYYGNLVKYWPVSEKITVLNNEQKILDSGHGFWSWRRSLGVLRRQIKKDRVDYVLVGNILPLGTAAALISLIQSLKFGVFLHGLDWTYAVRNQWKRKLVKFIIRRSDRIICANSYVAEQVADFYPQESEKIVVINPGVSSPAPLISSEEIKKLDEQYHLYDQTVLLSLGRLVKRKGVDLVIKALASLPLKEQENLLYFIAGQGPDEAYLKQLVPAALKEKIIFLGALEDKDKWLWLHRADIFLMPARNIEGDFEGFGIVYLEANLSGRPVIAGRAGGVTDAVIDGQTGLLVDPENEADLSQAILRLVADTNLRNRLGRQGRDRAIKEFNWDQQIKRLVDIIKI